MSITDPNGTFRRHRHRRPGSPVATLVNTGTSRPAEPVVVTVRALNRATCNDVDQLSGFPPRRVGHPGRTAITMMPVRRTP